MARGNNSRINRYKKLTQDEQILHRPDTTIGSVSMIETTERVFDSEQNKFISKSMIISDAVTNIFLEVLHNSADNKERSEAKGVPFSGISIEMNNEYIKITNDGEPIPIVVHPQWNTWIPQVLFGDYNTSSNYNDDEERKTLGRNGFGVKLVNTFSSEFYIDLSDSRTGLRYQQSWFNNKKNRDEPIITEEHGINSSVTVMWKLDFARFGMQCYNDDHIQLFERHCIDVAYSMKTVVNFNGRTYDFRRLNNPTAAKDIKDSENQNLEYLKLYMDSDDLPNTLMVHGDDYELIFVDMPNNAQVVSFVNGKCMQGGVHVTCSYDVIKKTIIPMINEKYNSDDKGSKTKSRQFTVNVTNLKRHLGIFINARLTNPTFKSQYKVNLVSPKISINISDKQFKKLLKWNFVKALKDDLIGKTLNILKADETKGRRSRVKVKNAEDANYAGTKKSLECLLVLTEGDSAKGYAVKWISCFPKNRGRDYYGIFPLRGKPLNVRNSDARRVVENKELLAVKKLIGIKQDYDYSTQEQINTLRYGSILMMVDSDEDGKHILGLIINMFHALWPGLLYRGYIKYLITPILRVTRGRSSLNFYTEEEYDQWKLNQTNQRMSVRYYKGLGSSSTKEIKSDFNEAKCAEMSCNDIERVNNSINLAFNSKETKQRKKWLTVGFEKYDQPQQYNNDQQNKLGHITLTYIPIDKFILEQMIHFSKADNCRSIPSFMDGLKVSQRKALWTSFKVATKLVSLTSFVGSIQQATKYRHGETSMQGTVIGMAQSYIWKNNLAYFEEEGNYGTRNLNGKDHAAARYIYTKLRPWVRHVFMPEDDELLEPLTNENVVVEPKRLLPIIPMWLVNGAYGIGTGFSTNILKHNPIDVVDILINMCDTIGIKLKPTNIKPWYRGFKGDISIVTVDNTTKKVTKKNETYFKDDKDQIEDKEIQDKDQIDIELEDIEDNEDDKIRPSKTKIKFTGIFDVQNVNNKFNIKITELPIDVSTFAYSEFLKSLEDKGIISSYLNNSNDVSVDFTVNDVKTPEQYVGQSVETVFKLSATKTTSNMVLLDDNDIPVKYNTIDDIIEKFFVIRLQWYWKRKDMMIENTKREISRLSLEAKLIRLVVDGVIVVFKRPKTEIESELQKHDIPYAIFDKLKISRFTREEIDKIMNKINELTTYLGELERCEASTMWKNDLMKLRSILIKM